MLLEVYQLKCSVVSCTAITMNNVIEAAGAAGIVD